MSKTKEQYLQETLLDPSAEQKRFVDDQWQQWHYEQEKLKEHDKDHPDPLQHPL